MMKRLPFSVLDILPGLLDHKKDQTIRLAKLPLLNNEGNVRVMDTDADIPFRPCHYKVGEILLPTWKIRNSPKNALFCERCGKEAYYDKQVLHCPEHGEIHGWDVFHKIMGKVQVTDVFLIRMWKSFGVYYASSGKKAILGDNLAQLAYRDSGGRWTINDMFAKFDKMYDLSIEKPFWVIRWKWLE